jgi:hypothetical protein
MELTVDVTAYLKKARKSSKRCGCVSERGMRCWPGRMTTRVACCMTLDQWCVKYMGVGGEVGYCCGAGELTAKWPATVAAASLLRS